MNTSKRLNLIDTISSDFIHCVFLLRDAIVLRVKTFGLAYDLKTYSLVFQSSDACFKSLHGVRPTSKMLRRIEGDIANFMQTPLQIVQISMSFFKQIFGEMLKSSDLNAGVFRSNSYTTHWLLCIVEKKNCCMHVFCIEVNVFLGSTFLSFHNIGLS